MVEVEESNVLGGMGALVIVGKGEGGPFRSKILPNKTTFSVGNGVGLGGGGIGDNVGCWVG
jgi:hypothetical protein